MTKATYGDQAKGALLEGMAAVRAAVAPTLGPAGRSVVLPGARLSNDGTTIAEAISFSDQRRSGAELLKEAARRSGQRAGDGSTTTILLAEALVRDGLRRIVAGSDPVALVRGLRRAEAEVIAFLEARARPLAGGELEAVCRIASGDPELGRLMAEALARVGTGGVVELEAATTLEHQLSFHDGLQIAAGSALPQLLGPGPRRAEKVAVLVSAEELDRPDALLPLLAEVAEARRPLLVVAPGLSAAVTALLAVNADRGLLDPLALIVPGPAQEQGALLEDIAAFVDAPLVASDLGRQLEQTTLADLGQADRVGQTLRETTIIASAASRQQQLRRLRGELGDGDDPLLLRRIAALDGRLALVAVGGATATEQDERQQRLDDARRAGQLALEGGVVAGAGTSLFAAAAAIALVGDGDERQGGQTLALALESVVRQLARNAGQSAALAAHQQRHGDHQRTSDELVAAGVLDPTWVLTTACQSAVSLAAASLLGEVLLIDHA